MPPRSSRNLLGYVADAAIIALACAFLFTLVASKDSAPRGVVGRPGIEERPVQDWDRLMASALSVDSLASPIEILVFIDHQCPSCALLNDELAELGRAHPNAIRVSTLFFPLPQHANAVLAANIASCAHEQGRLESATRLLYSEAHRLTPPAVASIAERAGVVDGTAFSTCMTADTVPAVRKGIHLARQLGLVGTPSILVNGLQLIGIETVGQLNDYVANLQGRLLSDGAPK